MNDPVTRAYIKPVEGCIIRDPDTKQIVPSEGMSVTIVGPVGRWWRRRLRNGVIVLAKPPVAKEPEPEEYKVPAYDRKQRKSKGED